MPEGYPITLGRSTQITCCDAAFVTEFHTGIQMAGAFAGFAAWGFFSKRDLGGFGSFAFMGLIGLIVLGVVQIFWNNGALNFLLGCGGVIVFTLLTAWDMQKIRQSARSGAQRLAVLGALSLYLDFINLFISLLRLFGGNGSRS